MISTTRDNKTLYLLYHLYYCHLSLAVCKDKMGPTKPIILPVIPLARDTVLLPGIVLRIPVAGNRPDIPALLSSVYSRAASKTPSQRLDNVNIACVPLNSPFLSPNGQKMIAQDEQSHKPKGIVDIGPESANKEDLFGYGVAAKISGVEGRGTGEFALLVEGVARVRIDKLTQERPFFEAEVTYEYDDGITWMWPVRG
jgi:ATP-dependent Lon protease